MNVAKMIIGSVVVSGLAVVGAASMQPEIYHVERSVTTSAPPSTVYRILSDFGRFGEWSPWEKLDPAMTKSIDGPAATVGTSYSWKGNDEVGAGRMTIVGLTPDQKVDIKLEFTAPWVSTSQTSWTVVADGAQSKITWAMDGRNEGLVAKVAAMFMNMDKMLGKDFDAGLATLKTVAEAAAVTPAG